MARSSSVFACSACGAQTPKWQGQCPHCEAWNCLEKRTLGSGARATAAAAPAVQSLAPLPRSLIAFGELGLTGELRPVAYGEERLREAHKQGFTRALVARDNAPRKPLAGLEVLGAGRVGEALAAAFSIEADLAILNPPARTRERS